MRGRKRQTCEILKAANTIAHLGIQDLVVGAGGQQQAWRRRVGELTVVDLLLVLLLKDPEQHGSLHVPHLQEEKHSFKDAAEETLNFVCPLLACCCDQVASLLG